MEWLAPTFPLQQRCSVPGSLIAGRPVLLACTLIISHAGHLVAAVNGEVIMDRTSGSFWHATGWELRMWFCQTIDCRQYFSRVSVVRLRALSDVAFLSKSAVEGLLIVQAVRRQLSAPSGPEIRLIAEAIR